MKTTLQIIAYAIISIAFYLLCTCGAKADTASTNPPANFFGDIASKVGITIPPSSVLDFAAGASYTPNLASGQKLGYWIAGTYATETNALLAYEIGVYDMKFSKQKSTMLYPNGMVLIRKTWHVKQISVTPLIEFGAAIDGGFQDPYGVTGAGLAVGWRGFSLLGGVERWTGPRNSLTPVKIGLAYRLEF